MALRSFSFLAATAQTASSLDNGLGKLPQMGWNSWYDLMCGDHMNEDYIKTEVDAFVKMGLPKLGYTYINLDDCIVETNRTADGKLQHDRQRFKSGMRALSDYVHEQSLYFGVYTDRGPLTCAGKAAALGNEIVDAQTYAHDWQIDYLKEDSCHASSDHQTAFKEYGAMRDALNATGRPIFYSLCGWNDWYAPEGAKLANSWRTGPDDGNWGNILINVDIMSAGSSHLGNLAQFSGPDKGWNDPCLLISKDADGKRLITEVQTRTQFSLWSVLAAPLLISGNLANMSKEDLETYTNKAIIEINQDPMGQQGSLLAGDLIGKKGGAVGLFAKKLHDGSQAVLVVNTSPDDADFDCDAACFQKLGWDAKSLPIKGTDLYSGKAIPDVLSLTYTWKVADNGGSQFLRFKPTAESLII